MGLRLSGLGKIPDLTLQPQGSYDRLTQERKAKKASTDWREK